MARSSAKYHKLLSEEATRIEIGPDLTKISSELDPESRKLIFTIKEVSDKFTYTWSSINVNNLLPIQDLQLYTHEDAEEKNAGLFIEPEMLVETELNELSRDARTGEMQKLSKEQLKSIQSNGWFEVDSKSFEGQKHRWQMVGMFEQGKQHRQTMTEEDLATLIFLAKTLAKKRFASRYFSLWYAIHSFGKGLWQMLDIMIGLPYQTSKQVATVNIKDELESFIANKVDFLYSSDRQELIEFISNLNNLFHNKPKTYRLKELDKKKIMNLHPICAYMFREKISNGNEIDLRCWNKNVHVEASKILKKIDKHLPRNWQSERRRVLIEEACKASENSRCLEEGGGDVITPVNERPIKTIRKEIQRELRNEYFMHLMDGLRSNELLKEKYPGLSATMIDRMIFNRAESDMEKEWKKSHNYYQTRIEAEKHLKNKYPILSRDRTWLEKRIKSRIEKMHGAENDKDQNKFMVSRLLEATEGIGQERFFLATLDQFNKEERVKYNKIHKTVKSPVKEFEFHTKIWFPSNWKQYKSTFLEDQDITHTESMNPRFDKNKTLYMDSLKSKGETNVSYHVDKYVVWKSSTFHPFWRWKNFFLQTWTWLWNIMFILGYVIPWNSHVSLRALFGKKAFYPVWKLNKKTGYMHPYTKIPSLASRLWHLWHHVRKYRRKFEDLPDTGLMPKNMRRHFNRIWNYLCKGIFGTIIYVVMIPPICIISSSLSFLLAILSPIWVPLGSALLHILTILIYDMNYPTSSRKWFVFFKAFLYRVIILGFIQPVVVLITIFLICPFVLLCWLIILMFKRCLKSWKDCCLFHCIIKTSGRIPASDDFSVAIRVAGPGLASSRLYQISPDQALIALEAQMFQDILDMWHSKLREEINAPKSLYSLWLQNVFDRFSMNVNWSGKIIVDMQKHESANLTTIDKAYHHAKAKIGNHIPKALHSRMKLTERDLQTTLKEAEQMLKNHYLQKLREWNDELNDENFWESKGLEKGDWEGFARSKLSNILGHQILTPMEREEEGFSLEVKNESAVKRYFKMMQTSEFDKEEERQSVLTSECRGSEEFVTEAARHMRRQLMVELQSAPFHQYTNSPRGATDNEWTCQIDPWTLSLLILTKNYQISVDFPTSVNDFLLQTVHTIDLRNNITTQTKSEDVPNNDSNQMHLELNYSIEEKDAEVSVHAITVDIEPTPVSTSTV